MLATRGFLENRFEDFKLGADDCLKKPFSLVKLAARVKVLPKRISCIPSSRLLVEGLSLDVNVHEACRTGRHIAFNPTLFRLLPFLMQNPHRVIKGEELECVVWQDDPLGGDALCIHLSNLRQVINLPFDRLLLYTVRGFGYKLTDKNAND